MKNTTKKLVALFALVASFCGSLTTASANVCGVNNVTVNQSGELIAVYSQNPDGTWNEVGMRPGGTTRVLHEVGRDKWSIYLSDGFATVQLDLFTNKVNYSDTSGCVINNLYQVVAHHR